MIQCGIPPTLGLSLVWFGYLNILQGGTDSAVTSGLNSPEFQTADTLNNKIIRVINNEMKPFREYVKALNDNERAKLEEDFLFKYGVLSFDELTDKQKKKFKKLNRFDDISLWLQEPWD